MKKIPSEDEIKKSVAKVGYEKIVLNRENRTVFLKERGMKISFGAIGKGYAVDKAKELLISKQVVGGIINAGGDITTWGTNVSGEKWIVGIGDPLKTGQTITWLPIVESSVSTSGSRDNYVTFKGKRYSHIIDPRTGYPASRVAQISIFAKSAELCDALATAILVLGRDAGLSLVNQLGGTEAILLDQRNKVYKSSGILFERNP